MKKNPKFCDEGECVLLLDVGHFDLIVLSRHGTHVVGYSNPMWFNFYGYDITSGDGRAGGIIGD